MRGDNSADDDEEDEEEEDDDESVDDAFPCCPAFGEGATGGLALGALALIVTTLRPLPPSPPLVSSTSIASHSLPSSSSSVLASLSDAASGGRGLVEGGEEMEERSETPRVNEAGSRGGGCLSVVWWWQ
jgi:hypothetical protein